MSRVRTRVIAVVAWVVTAVFVLTSAPASATTGPTTPTNLRVVDLWSTSATIAWNASTDTIDGTLYYEVSIDTPDPWTATPVPTSQRFDGLGAGVTYTFSARAVNRLGNRSAWASLSFTTPTGPQPPPAAPANLRPVYVDGVVDGLAWDAPAHNGPMSYRLYVGPSVLAIVSKPSITVRSLVNEWCINPGKHTFVVQANDSAHSQPLTVTIPKPHR
jgi:hypothetical protein